MSDENNGISFGATPKNEGGAASDEQQLPPVMLAHQYLKDLSFENPSTPHRPYRPDQKTDVNVKVDVTAAHLGERMFEVTLHIEFKAVSGDNPVYLGEVVYAGMAQIGNLRKEDIEPVLLIEVARQLFPYARSIVSFATRDGGFPPLLLAPFDFVDLYRKRVARRAAEAGSASGEQSDAGQSDAGHASEGQGSKE